MSDTAAQGSEETLPGVVRAYLDAYNAKDVPSMLACLAKDVRFVNFADGVVTAETIGIAAFRELAGAGVEMFSERHQKVTNCIVAPERVALRIDYRATLARDLPNGWTKGQAIALSGTTFMQVRDGLIAEIIDFA